MRERPRPAKTFLFQYLAKAAHRLRREGDVGIDPEQVGEGFVSQEFDHHFVARAGDEAFRMHMQDANRIAPAREYPKVKRRFT
jgi:hypothetical protein